MSKALVILSGGQDSITCLGWALKHYGEVEAIAFNYGQRHKIELECAKKVCDDHNVRLKIVDIAFFGALVNSALTDEDGDLHASHNQNENVPASFVPNRNALFITLAHAYAQEIKASNLVTGVCQTDYSGYPDCRESFISFMQTALNVGYETSIAIQTPLMYLTKAQTFQMAEDHDFLDIVINDSHTCYNGDHDTRHDWGFGCGECPSCELRAKGYNEFIETKEPNDA